MRWIIQMELTEEKNLTLSSGALNFLDISIRSNNNRVNNNNTIAQFFMCISSRIFVIGTCSEQNSQQIVLMDIRKIILSSPLFYDILSPTTNILLTMCALEIGILICILYLLRLHEVLEALPT